MAWLLPSDQLCWRCLARSVVGFLGFLCMVGGILYWLWALWRLSNVPPPYPYWPFG